MDYKVILWLLSVIIFWGYAGWYITKYGIPKSWSDTFYRLNEIYNSKNKGFLLTGALWGMLFPMLPLVVENNPLMFPVLVAIGFIGAAPAFKDSKLEYWVHMVGSYVAVLLGTLAFGVSYNMWHISILLLGIILGLEFKWKPKNKTMWIESIVILSGHIIVLFKNVL